MRRFVPTNVSGRCIALGTAAPGPFLHWSLAAASSPGCFHSFFASSRAASSALKTSRVALRKRFGQHLLKNADVVKNIVDAADIQPTESVFEIGPGTGNMTVHMLPRARCVYAAELDSRLAEVVTKRVAGLGYADRFFCINEDFLKVPLPAFDKLVANIPYQISSPVLTRLFTHVPRPNLAVIMFQLEFAERMVAQPGTAQYSRLSVNCALMSHRIRMVMKIGREQFRPPPKVDSAVVEIVPAGPPAGLDFGRWDAFLRVAFSGKNKRLRSVLTNKHVLATLLAERARGGAGSPPASGGPDGDGDAGSSEGSSGNGGSGDATGSAVTASAAAPAVLASAPAPAVVLRSAAPAGRLLSPQLFAGWQAAQQRLAFVLAAAAASAAASAQLSLLGSSLFAARPRLLLGSSSSSGAAAGFGSAAAAAGYHTSATAAAPAGRGSRDANRNRSGRGNFERAAAAAAAAGSGATGRGRDDGAGSRDRGSAGRDSGRGWDSRSAGGSGSREIDLTGGRRGEPSADGAGRPPSRRGGGGSSFSRGRRQSPFPFPKAPARQARGPAGGGEGEGEGAGSGSGSGMPLPPQRPMSHLGSSVASARARRLGSSGGPGFERGSGRPGALAGARGGGAHRRDGGAVKAKADMWRPAGGSASASANPSPDAAAAARPLADRSAGVSDAPSDAAASAAVSADTTKATAPGSKTAGSSDNHKGKGKRKGNGKAASAASGRSSPVWERRGVSAAVAHKSRWAALRQGEPALPPAAAAAAEDLSPEARRRLQRRSLLAQSTAGDLLPLSTMPQRRGAGAATGAAQAPAAAAKGQDAGAGNGAAKTAAAAAAPSNAAAAPSNAAAAAAAPSNAAQAVGDGEDVDVELHDDDAGDHDDEDDAGAAGAGSSSSAGSTVATSHGRVSREDIVAARASIDAVLAGLGALDWRANGMGVAQFRAVFDELEAAGWKFPRAHERQFPSFDWGDKDEKEDKGDGGMMKDTAALSEAMAGGEDAKVAADDDGALREDAPKAAAIAASSAASGSEVSAGAAAAPLR